MAQIMQDFPGPCKDFDFDTDWVHWKGVIRRILHLKKIILVVESIKVWGKQVCKWGGQLKHCCNNLDEQWLCLLPGQQDGGREKKGVEFRKYFDNRAYRIFLWIGSKFWDLCPGWFLGFQWENGRMNLPSAVMGKAEGGAGFERWM